VEEDFRRRDFDGGKGGNDQIDRFASLQAPPFRRVASLIDADLQEKSSRRKAAGRDSKVT
jgi:hypothetical protein